jgi:REP element-mobilizing transposase RayT
VVLNGIQARAVARAFAKILKTLNLPAYACAVMPDHSHLVLPRHPNLTIEELVGFLKRAATRELRAEGIHPLRDHPKCDGSLPTPWVLGGWNRFLNDEDDIRGAIDYVVKNPTKIGLPKQNWSFVTPFDRVRSGVAWPRRLNE